MRKLEVAPFAPDLRTDQHASALLLGEERGVAVALEQREPFVEEPGVDLEFALEPRVDLLREVAAAADEQHFIRAELFQQRGQPFDLCIEVAALRQYFQRHEARFSFREAGERGAGVAEHHAPDAEFIQQGRRHRRARGFAGGREFVHMPAHARGFRAEEFPVRGGQRLARQQTVHGLGDLLVVLRLFEETREVAVTIRIKEA